MSRWKYFKHSCDVCGKAGTVRADVHYRLGREKRAWVCRPCSSAQGMRKASTTHGMYGTPTYVSWRRMKDRCLNKNHMYYHLYGGQGVTIAQKWMDFEGFLEDMGKRPAGGYSLDRIDNNRGYYKENCRWIPRRDQPKNRRNCKKPYVPPPMTNDT